MLSIYWIILLGSAAVFIPLLLIDRKASEQEILPTLLLSGVATVCSAVALIILEPRVEVRGDTSWSGIVFCYLAMALGMAAHYFFYKSSRARFRLLNFVRPFLISPIVFIPLLGVVNAARVGRGPFESADIMLLLVAFQNGFFWQYFFDTEARRHSQRSTG